MFSPKLEILPTPQRELWPRLGAVPEHFVLYGGTAVALRRGHRQSVDFDFFSAQAFRPASLEPLLQKLASQYQMLQESPNTVSANLVLPSGEVKISFFGELGFGQIFPPDRCKENGVLVASLRDMLGIKLKVIHQRVEARDYLDIAAILEAGLSLEEGLGYAEALYPRTTNPAITLQTLCWFKGGNLETVPKLTQQFLIHAATAVREIREFTGSKHPIGWRG